MSGLNLDDHYFEGPNRGRNGLCSAHGKSNQIRLDKVYFGVPEYIISSLKL